MRVLLVEDHAETAMMVELMLRSEGFNVLTTREGEEGVELAKVYDYDLILLDLGLPDISGLDVLRRLRAAKVLTPVIIISAQQDITTKVKAFAAGSDDYIAKPFHKDELISRMHAVIRRSRGMASSVVQIGDLAVDLGLKAVRTPTRAIHFTGKEYMVLEALVARLGNVVAKSSIMDSVYGGMDEPDLKIIDVYVCKVRKKFRAAGLGQVIESSWGRGYYIPAPGSPEAAQRSLELHSQGTAS